jgi:orotate phosphoribosyltransferase
MISRLFWIVVPLAARFFLLLSVMYDRQALVELVRSRALRFGNFTLASGKQAKYYLDGKQVTLDSRGAVLVAEGLLDLLAQQGPLPKAVGGMAIGADPITAAIITVAGLRNISLAGILVRKEPKGHGTNQYVDGPVEPGDTVAIVEDVVTTGGSSLQAIERVQQFGLRVTCVAAIIDRLEGGAKTFAERAIPFYSLLTIRDFGIQPP